MPAKILLADKSITIQKVVEMLFAGRDYEVVCMSDGEAALNDAPRIAPDIVLVDVDLPRVDGYSFAAKLKKTPGFGEMPIILMMSRDDVYDHVKGKQSGINDTIVKPFESQELIGKVKKAMSAAPPRAAQSAPAATVELKPQASVASEPRAMQPPKPSQPAKAAEPKQVPQNIFDIISDAPTPADLKKAAQPPADESVYEVEPVVEEVSSPFASEEATILPVGDQALEEMRAGLGLTLPEEPQPKTVSFESFDMDAPAPEPKQPEPVPPRGPVAAPSSAASEIVTFDNLDMARDAEKMFSPPPTPAQKAQPEPQPQPAPKPEVRQEELKGMVEEIVTRMTEKYLNDLPLPAPPKISDATVRQLVAENVANAMKDMPQPTAPQISEEMVRSIVVENVAKAVKDLPKPVVPQIPEETLRSMVAENVEKIAEKAIKDAPLPKISDDTIRRALQEAVTAVAKEMAPKIIEHVAWEVVPQLAEHLIKEEIEKLKAGLK